MRKEIDRYGRDVGALGTGSGGISSRGAGIDTDSILAGGEPSREIVDAASREGCDLIAMSTHGHRFVKDVLYGSVANEVRHITRVPVLLVRGGSELDRDTKERRAMSGNREQRP